MPTSFLLDTGPLGLLAHARQHGKPTADAAALDADVLIAAQAIELQAMSSG